MRDGAANPYIGRTHMSIVDKVKEMIGHFSDQAQQGIDTAGDMIDEKTGGTLSDQVDAGQEQAKDQVDTGQEQAKDQVGQEAPKKDDQAG
jgi:hypothetical protein